MGNYDKETRGSLWRKWDLHIHTPETKLNDCYKCKDGKDKWDEFCDTIYNSDVAAFGITDYFSCDNYYSFIKRYFDKYPNSNKVFFPNIEFRLEVSVNKRAEEVNLHILFSNQIQQEKLHKFLIKLDTNLTRNNSPISCKDLQGEDYSSAGVNYVKIRQVLKDVFGKDKCYLIFAAANNAGLRADSRSPRKLHITDEIDKICDGFLGGSQNVKYYLNEDRYESKEKAVPKPTIGGCDAHSLEDLTNWLGKHVISESHVKEITWIKAETTFEGLKQIIYEPETRVRIQELQPDEKIERHVISELQFESDESLFGNQKILLNENLNSIIGGKSSGKSLLMYSIADAIDPEQVKRINNRLNFQGYNFLYPYNFKVIWKNNDVDILNDNNPDSKQRKITYIPQLYINYLAEKNNKIELNGLIHSILLQNVDFKIFYEDKKKQIEKLTGEVDGNIMDLMALRQKAIKLHEQYKENGTVDALTKSIITLNKKIEEIKRNNTLTEKEFSIYDSFLKKLENFHEQKKKLQTKKLVLQKVLIKIREVIDNLLSENEVNKGHLQKILDEFIEVPEDVVSIINSLKAKFNLARKDFITDINDLKIEEQIKVIENNILEINNNLKPYLEKINNQKELIKLTEQIQKENEKKEISNSLKKQIECTINEYINLKKNISKLLSERYQLYLDIEREINSKKSQIHDDIKLECKLIFKQEKFRFYEQVNKNKIDKEHIFYKIFVDDYIEYSRVPDLLRNILRVKDNILVLENNVSFPLNQNVSFSDIYINLTKDCFEFDFKVSYKNDELLNMSPGKKGTVLLILFLQISSAEYPILIDQPEDNLDNRTIYELLCQIIKSKKSERQIVIVSHNANLVVATDSENVIVANQDGQSEDCMKCKHRFEYVNGPLEHSVVKDESINGVLYQQGIKEHVCDILEGGNEAFKKRERKYALLQ